MLAWNLLLDAAKVSASHISGVWLARAQKTSLLL